MQGPGSALGPMLVATTVQLGTPEEAQTGGTGGSAETQLTVLLPGLFQDS